MPQNLGRFFPERYQHGGYAKLADVITSYMATNTKKSIRGDRCHAAYWLGRFPNWRLNAITPTALDRAKHDLTAKGAGSTNGNALHEVSSPCHEYCSARREAGPECHA